MAVLFGGGLGLFNQDELIEKARVVQDRFGFSFPFLQRAVALRNVVKAGDLGKVGMRDAK